MQKTNFVDELTWQEFAELLTETDLAIIPVGVLEVHGLHAPIGLDNWVAEEIAERLSMKVRAALFPVIKFGHSVERADTSCWSGTISISTETMARFYTEIGKELSRHGFKRIVFVSGHFNNANALSTAAYNIWNETGSAVGILEWFTAAGKEVSKYSKCPHADALETSLLLTTKKADLLKLDKAQANPNPIPPLKDEIVLWDRGLQDKYTYSLDSRYLQEVGNWGDPSQIRKEGVKIWKSRGEEVINATVNVGVQLVKPLENM